MPLLFAALLVALPLCPAAVRAPLAFRPLRFLSEMSYGFFLFDIPRAGAPASVLELSAIVLPATALAAWLATRYVERPIRERARALAERRRSVELQAAARSSERLRAAGGGAAPANSGGAIAR